MTTNKKNMNMTLANIIGSNIKLLREARGLTQEDLARTSGAGNYQQISKYERGENKPGEAKLGKIAAALGVSVSELMIVRMSGDIPESLSTAKEPNAQDMLPDPTHMTMEQKLQWAGFNTKDIRQMQEWSKLSEEEQDEMLKRLCNQNIEKGRY